MHKAILGRLQADPRQVLARFPSGKHEGISIVGAYREGVEHPLWIGKTTSSKSGMERLRKEHRALSYLQPWAEAFHLPSELHYEDSPLETCLIQSGVPGQPSQFDVGRSNALPGPAVRALAWLEKFQAAIPLPEDIKVEEIVARSLKEFVSPPARNQALDEVIEMVRREQPQRPLPRAATHGDYWRGNVFFGPDGVSVIDWDELRTSLALDDVFSYLLSCVPWRGRTATAVEAFQYTFFSPSPASAYLRQRVQALHLGEREVRFCFYLFILNRLVWKEFAADWLALMEWLRGRSYPTPPCLAA